MKIALARKYLKNSTYVFFVTYLVLSWIGTVRLANAGLVKDSTTQFIYITYVALAFFAVWQLLTRLFDLSYRYAKIIKGSPEQPAFLHLTHGALGLYLSLLFTAFLNSARIPTVGDQSYEKLTIALYYLAGILAMYYFYQFGRAGQIFANCVEKTKNYIQFVVIAGIILPAGCFWIWETQISRNINPFNANHILSYIPDNLVFYSLFLPLTFMWVYGLSGAYGIYLFLKHSGGIIYQKAFAWLSGGAAFLVIVSVSRHVSDYISGSPSQVSLIDDFPRLAILFPLVIFAVFSMYNGVSKLNKFEQTPK